MSISYSAIVGSRKVTLPSVDMFGTDMNIMKDPPKGIMTRRIDKIQDTQLLNEMVDGSGDRICESIQVYGRGINPFVRVSYGNNGSNGGSRVNGFSSGGNGSGNSGQQSYPPYRLGPEGAFRPPIVPPQNLLPLSRLPRTLTYQVTNPGQPNYSMKLQTPQEGDKTAGVKKENTMLRTSVGSGVRARDLTTTNVLDPTNGVKLHLPIDWNLNPGSSLTEKHLDNTYLSTEKYTHDVRQYETNTNASRDISITPIEEIMGNTIRTKEAFNLDVKTQAKGYEAFEATHELPELERALPVHASRTNVNDARRHVTPIDSVYISEQTVNRPTASAYSNRGGSNISTIDTISTRDYALKPTISAGGFDGRGSMPTQERASAQVQLNSSKLARNKFIMDMQMRH